MPHPALFANHSPPNPTTASVGLHDPPASVRKLRKPPKRDSSNTMPFYPSGASQPAPHCQHHVSLPSLSRHTFLSGPRQRSVSDISISPSHPLGFQQAVPREPPAAPSWYPPHHHPEFQREIQRGQPTGSASHFPPQQSLPGPSGSNTIPQRPAQHNTTSQAHDLRGTTPHTSSSHWHHPAPLRAPLPPQTTSTSIPPPAVSTARRTILHPEATPDTPTQHW
ncbi:hypothetical protein BS17DRAFT_790105 [Gyrodon lividus]|nr:hypothetical protein BS17DRAFT_790105 [Gyrodon lividus]